VFLALQNSAPAAGSIFSGPPALRISRSMEGFSAQRAPREIDLML
jgi:hypothetical protein